MRKPSDARETQLFTYATPHAALDEVNIRILEELRRDPRLTMTALGRRIGMSAPAVTERVRRLEEVGDHSRLPARPRCGGAGIAAHRLYSHPARPRAVAQSRRAGAQHSRSGGMPPHHRARTASSSRRTSPPSTSSIACSINSWSTATPRPPSCSQRQSHCVCHHCRIWSDGANLSVHSPESGALERIERNALVGNGDRRGAEVGCEG